MTGGELDMVIGLELELLDPAVRHDADRLRGLIDESFVEFGASGQV